MSTTNSGIYTALRTYIKNFLGYDDDHTRRAYIDNIPLPTEPFVFITVKPIQRNATNEHSYTDDIENNVHTQDISGSFILDVQFDFYGQESVDAANLIKTIFRDEKSTDFFAQYGLVPLYEDDIIPMPTVSENENFLVRNSLTVHFNLKQSYSYPQDFFDNIEITSMEALK